MNSGKARSVLMHAALALSMSLALDAAAAIVVPNNLAGVEGNVNSNVPFARGAGATNGRAQQVYASSQFSALGPEGALITQLAFRPDGLAGGPFAVTTPSLQIFLSTTNAAPDALSTNFDANVGPNQTLVFDGPLTISSLFTGPVGGPKDFDIVITLENPFVYVPSSGNLLLDVVFPNGTAPQIAFDAENTSGDPISIVFKDNSFAGPPIALTSGLVTQFTTAAVPPPAGAVPEPSPWILLGTAFAALAFWRRRRA